jgi:hypothetical protein
MRGQAAAASALIPLLENSPRLDRVEFASPVTRGRDKEQFQIKAAWENAKGRPGTAAVQAPGGPPPQAPARRPPGRAGGEAAAPVRAGEGR